MLRRLAFHDSESDLRHWMVLLFADRVNMVEGLGADLMRGHVLNLFAEMGGKAEFQYNRPAAVRKVASWCLPWLGWGFFSCASERVSRTTGVIGCILAGAVMGVIEQSGCIWKIIGFDPKMHCSA